MTEIFFKLEGLSPEVAKRLEINLHALIVSQALFIKGGSFTVHMSDDNYVSLIKGEPVLYRRTKDLQKLENSAIIPLTKHLP